MILLAAFATTLLTQVGAPNLIESFVARRFAKDEKAVYDFHTKVTALGNTSDAVIELVVLKTLAPGSARLSLKTASIKHSATKDEAQPADVVTDVTSNSLPDKLNFDKDPDTMYISFMVLGATPDRQVKLGKEFEFEWKAFGSPLTLKGKGKVLEFTPAAWTVRTYWKLTASKMGIEQGIFEFTNVCSLKDGSLQSAEGTFGLQDLPFFNLKVTRKP